MSKPKVYLRQEEVGSSVKKVHVRMSANLGKLNDAIYRLQCLLLIYLIYVNIFGIVNIDIRCDTKKKCQISNSHRTS